MKRAEPVDSHCSLYSIYRIYKICHGGRSAVAKADDVGELAREFASLSSNSPRPLASWILRGRHVETAPYIEDRLAALETELRGSRPDPLCHLYELFRGCEGYVQKATDRRAPASPQLVGQALMVQSFAARQWTLHASAANAEAAPFPDSLTLYKRRPMTNSYLAAGRDTLANTNRRGRNAWNCSARGSR